MSDAYYFVEQTYAAWRRSGEPRRRYLAARPSTFTDDFGQAFRFADEAEAEAQAAAMGDDWCVGAVFPNLLADLFSIGGNDADA